MNRRSSVAFVAAGLTLAAVVSNGAAQEPASKSAGIYTNDQAARGEETYMSSCVGCHPKGTYAAPAFRKHWNGQPASQLFEFLRGSMPKEQPGALEPEEYAQVIAYLMKINGAPSGEVELPADVKALRQIRISMPQ